MFLIFILLFPYKSTRHRNIKTEFKNLMLLIVFTLSICFNSGKKKDNVIYDIQRKNSTLSVSVAYSNVIVSLYYTLIITFNNENRITLSSVLKILNFDLVFFYKSFSFIVKKHCNLPYKSLRYKKFYWC